jgi:hypothetical protein
MKDVSNAQRALWMVLITSLSAPFFAALIYMALSFAGPLATYILPSPGAQGMGEVAVGVFAWSAFPATVAALGLTPFVLQHGTFGWLHAAVAGILGFGSGAIIFPFADGGTLPFLAFLAGLLAIGVRSMLIAGGILLAEPNG